MQITSDYEVKAGLRDVTEGVLKYEGNVVEFTDRLLFIVASKHIGKYSILAVLISKVLKLLITVKMIVLLRYNSAAYSGILHIATRLIQGGCLILRLI